ncbi:MAG TPA: hypothetical protein QGF08_00165 [Candidatus Marinimicrobia bacterium]|jgi:hypothetical protein|nr:hypothetical protein [Candidatus Neomarinimicrobiota bacterium]MDP7330219.1 hypothetical protein [Candidatus Neomarinimicrobiota bacterium]HJM69280.1 hypothetical protein [Candidatus Neomarinimicrobiota bacterium]
MITSYVLVALSGVGLLFVGANHYFNFWPTSHITLDLLVSIIFIAAQTLVMFFFVGTGVNIKEYTLSHPEIGDKFYKGVLGIKRKLYPSTMMVTILFMTAVILDGAFYLGKVSEWWFYIFYVFTLYYYIKATLTQHKAFIGSTNIVLAMTGVVRK